MNTTRLQKNPAGWAVEVTHMSLSTCLFQNHMHPAIFPRMYWRLMTLPKHEAQFIMQDSRVRIQR